MIFSSQAGAAILLSCPVFLLAHADGADRVAPFSILQRTFSVFVIGSALLMTPLWPAYSESFARGDFEWVRATFRRSLVANAIIAGVPVFLLAAAAPRLTLTLSRGSVQATMPLAFAAALLSFLVATRHTLSMMVNGCGYLRRTAITFPLAAAGAVSCSLLPMRLPSGYGVPLWVAAAESLVVCALALDAAQILRAAPERARPVRQEVSA
jgi:O-antigen/teichoic acid export membrane protein